MKSYENEPQGDEYGRWFRKPLTTNKYHKIFDIRDGNLQTRCGKFLGENIDKLDWKKHPYSHEQCLICEADKHPY